MTDTTQPPAETLAEAQDKRRMALIERIGAIADMTDAKPLEGELGDIAYDLLRQAAAQISSDRLHINRLSRRAGGDAIPAGEAFDPTPLEKLADTMACDDPVSAITVQLMRAWAKVDPRSGVAQCPTSYVATFTDMARAVIAYTPKPPAGGDAGAVDLAALIKPWKNHHGPLPDFDSPIACVFDAGVQYAVELLAKELGVTEWTPCDGTEDYDGDLGGTLMNVVCEAMPFDQDGERMRPSDVAAALALPAPVVEGEWQKIVQDMLDGVSGARHRARAALSEGRSHG